MYQFKVEELGCASCVNTIEGAVKRIDPESQVSVDLRQRLVTVISGKTQQEISRIIEAEGYSVEGVTAPSASR